MLPSFSSEFHIKINKKGKGGKMEPASCEIQQEIKDATQTNKDINMIQK